jgi:hypothetical protein
LSDCNFPAHAKCRKSVGKTCHGCDKDLRKAAKLLNKKKPEPVAVGDQVPLFTLKDGKGKSYSIEDSLHMNKRIVLFFYPKGEITLPTQYMMHAWPQRCKS